MKTQQRIIAKTDTPPVSVGDIIKLSQTLTIKVTKVHKARLKDAILRSWNRNAPEQATQALSIH